MNYTCKPQKHVITAFPEIKENINFGFFISTCTQHTAYGKSI